MLRLIRDFVQVRDLCFLYGSASLGWKVRAFLYRKPVHSPRALLQIADLTSRNMAATRLDRRRAVEPVRRINPAASGGDSGAHSALFACLGFRI